MRAGEGGNAARLVGQGRGLGEGVEVAESEGERDRLLHVDHHLLLRLVHVAVRPARARRNKSQSLQVPGSSWACECIAGDLSLSLGQSQWLPPQQQCRVRCALMP